MREWCNRQLFQVSYQSCLSLSLFVCDVIHSNILICSAFVDLLEDLRRANDKQLEAYNDLRSENVIKLKNLRNELDMIIKG